MTYRQIDKEVVIPSHKTQNNEVKDKKLKGRDFYTWIIDAFFVSMIFLYMQIKNITYVTKHKSGRITAV
uniref:Uncharacterized protein n=1 Tax=Nelumbo nucifera TaxID=4432 RepID=A0A822YV72_NELNU|nr:TPA_asm: hypothetical protein HUJ06_007213 [Nelumbo nucifera]